MQAPVVIVGGGVIGLSIGWMLQKAGCSTVIFDRGAAGREASWLSAGMLAPQTEMGYEDEALYSLNRESVKRWPSFVKELEADSGIRVDFRTEGILHVADDRDATEALKRHYDFQKKQGLDVEWLTGAEAREMEPFISPRVPAAVFARSDHQVDNRLLVQALIEAYRALGGLLHEHTPVVALHVDEQNGRERLVVTAGGDRVEAGCIVLAAGAWSRQIEGLEPSSRPPVRPVKGQMIQLRMKRPFELRHVVWGRGAYLAPKSNGRLLIGATVEERGFDTEITAGGLYALLEAAWRVVPGIYDLEVTETWAGLRPGSRDNDPILGPTPFPGLFFATGHYRNGILLAPVTAEEMARLVLTGETSDWLRPFLPNRFTHPISIP